jgi:hypothetical protein
LVPQLVKRFPNSRIFQELNLGKCRIDVAVVTDSFIWGFEIKGEGDTLKRLPSQAGEYQKFCRFLTLVATPNHIDQATSLLPDFWGISTPTEAIRESLTNPNTDSESFVYCLLWKPEKCRILAGFDREGLWGEKSTEEVWMRKTSRELNREIISRLTPADIEKTVCQLLLTRDYSKSSWQRRMELIDTWTIPGTATQETTSTETAQRAVDFRQQVNAR